ncbi:MAG: ABC transporter ATP-binding protein [Halobacteriales archaeon]
MGTMTGGLTIDGCSLTFGAVDALDDVSIDVEHGEFFTLVGPSGCGKTTTLRTVAGLESPDTGSVSIGGDDVTGVPPDERDIGIVFQNYALFPHMSVRENVAYGLRFRDPPGDVSAGERVTAMLDMVDMADFGDRDPEALSGGQQQRIALARALAPGPEVLLLDEPLSALDADLRQRLRVRIRTIQRDLSITTLYVTHDQAEALAISDRVAVMRRGRVEQVATPEQVYRQPATRFVAEFVGDNNLFGGTVDGDRMRIDGTDAALPLPPDADRVDGTSVTVGVRPEAISVDGDDTPTPGDRTPASGDSVTLSAAVRTAEFLGDAYRLHCGWQGREVLVKTGATDPPDGTVDLAITPADVRVL